MKQGKPSRAEKLEKLKQQEKPQKQEITQHKTPRQSHNKKEPYHYMVIIGGKTYTRDSPKEYNYYVACRGLGSEWALYDFATTKGAAESIRSQIDKAIYTDTLIIDISEPELLKEILFKPEKLTQQEPAFNSQKREKLNYKIFLQDPKTVKIVPGARKNPYNFKKWSWREDNKQYLSPDFKAARYDDKADISINVKRAAFPRGFTDEAYQVTEMHYKQRYDAYTADLKDVIELKTKSGISTWLYANYISKLPQKALNIYVGLQDGPALLQTKDYLFLVSPASLK